MHERGVAARVRIDVGIVCQGDKLLVLVEGGVELTTSCGICHRSGKMCFNFCSLLSFDFDWVITVYCLNFDASWAYMEEVCNHLLLLELIHSVLECLDIIDSIEPFVCDLLFEISFDLIYLCFQSLNLLD